MLFSCSHNYKQLQKVYPCSHLRVLLHLYRTHHLALTSTESAASEGLQESRLDSPLGAHFVLLSLMFLTSSAELFVPPFVTVPFPQLSLRGLWKLLQTQTLTWLEKAFSQKRGVKGEGGRRKRRRERHTQTAQYNTGQTPDLLSSGQLSACQKGRFSGKSWTCARSSQ